MGADGEVQATTNEYALVSQKAREAGRDVDVAKGKETTAKGAFDTTKGKETTAKGTFDKLKGKKQLQKEHDTLNLDLKNITR